jgi:hypothetical protein
LLIKILLVDIIPFRALISYCHQNQWRLTLVSFALVDIFLTCLSVGGLLPLPLCVCEAGFCFFKKI